MSCKGDAQVTSSRDWHVWYELRTKILAVGRNMPEIMRSGFEVPIDQGDG
jgi:hypothetical protein